MKKSEEKSEWLVLTSSETNSNCQYRNLVASVFKRIFLADSIQAHESLKRKKYK